MEKENSNEKEKNVSPILLNSIEILAKRSSESKKQWYIDSTLTRCLELDSYIQHPGKRETLRLTGVLAEGLFYTIFSGKKLVIANSNQNIDGIDFFLEGKPFNVTTNPDFLGKKFNSTRPPNILLPTYKGQSLYDDSSKKTNYLVKIHEDDFPYDEYKENILSLNYAILREMGWCLNYYFGDFSLKEAEIEWRNYEEMAEILTSLSTC